MWCDLNSLNLGFYFWTPWVCALFLLDCAEMRAGLFIGCTGAPNFFHSNTKIEVRTEKILWMGRCRGLCMDNRHVRTGMCATAQDKSKKSKCKCHMFVHVFCEASNWQNYYILQLFWLHGADLKLHLSHPGDVWICSTHIIEKATAVELKQPSAYYSPVSLLFAQKSDNCIFDWNWALSHFLAERHPSVVRLKRPANLIGNYRLLIDTHPLLCIFRVCQVKQRQIHTYILIFTSI